MSDLSPQSMFLGLEPAIVWKHFATLCAIPRASKDEARLCNHLQSWAIARGLTATVDAAGNLRVRKAASAGRERLPGVILQAHLDMVCQNNAETPHDFSRDPIRPLRRDGWLVAEGTTLGADNGIGVALMLAVLEDRSLQHGPIEALFTVDEEAGMGILIELAELFFIDIRMQLFGNGCLIVEIELPELCIVVSRGAYFVIRQRQQMVDGIGSVFGWTPQHRGAENDGFLGS